MTTVIYHTTTHLCRLTSRYRSFNNLTHHLVLAALFIGLSACSGTGLNSDGRGQAINELFTLADQGDAQAQYALANRYADGDGIQRDNVLAHMWFGLAAERLTSEERYEAIRARQRLDDEMFRHQVAESNRLARNWRLRRGRLE